MRVVLLHDELPPEPTADQADVLVQCEAVGAALKHLGHDVEVASLSLNLSAGAAALRRLAPDRVFNLVESVAGHGRLIYLAPALLDALQIPYVGAGAEAMFQTSCKTLTKERLRERGIDTPDWITANTPPGGEFARGRYIVKSVWEDASVGLDEDSVVEADSVRELQGEIEKRRAALGGEGFAEAYIDGREFNLALLAGPEGPHVLPAAEIEFVGYERDKARVVGYRAKWDESSYEYQNTRRRYDLPESDRPLLARMSDLALECWRLFGLRGWARVDFRVDQRGRSWILEINANPCLSPGAGFAAAVERSGLSYTQAIERILRDVPARCSREQPATFISH